MKPTETLTLSLPHFPHHPKPYGYLATESDMIGEEYIGLKIYIKAQKPLLLIAYRLGVGHIGDFDGDGLIGCYAYAFEEDKYMRNELTLQIADAIA